MGGHSDTGYSENDILENYGNDTTIQFIQKYIDKQRNIDNDRMNNVSNLQLIRGFFIPNFCTIIFLHEIVLLTPIFYTIFYTKCLLFLQQFVCMKFLLFTPNFLYQFSTLNFFTPIFYMKFLRFKPRFVHQNFAYLHSFFFENFQIRRKKILL